MSWSLALRAFFRALKDEQGAQEFLSGKKKIVKKKEVPPQEDKGHPHLHLLALLQKSGRLVDFLKEDLSQFTDAQVGAAARKVHLECAKSLEDLVAIRPVFDSAEEGSKVTVPAGYDPHEVRLTGTIQGPPPFHGILRHKGWKAHRHSLPKAIGQERQEILAHAEVEVQG